VTFFERCGRAEEPTGAAARYGPSGWPTEFGLAELSLYYIAAPLTELGLFDEALAAAKRALEFARQVDRPFALAGSFAAIGRAYLYRGRFGEAAAAFTRGLAVCRVGSSRSTVHGSRRPSAIPTPSLGERPKACPSCAGRSMRPNDWGT
jgi:tetratricopeptide (TPR) repeat protein